ncbi:MAG: hypothetical protein RMI56_07245 [Sulfolobales archaeon]|nr:hypothetical protein [Sulfolobales archaeon]MDW8083561.1 hypothetical protein [Sulfolobales archaeon]
MSVFNFMSFLTKMFSGGKGKRAFELSDIVVRLDLILREVRDVTERLVNRYRDLVREALVAKSEKKNERALVYANEAAQVSRYIKKAMITEMIVEQVKLRLETLGEVADITKALAGISSLLYIAKDHVSDIAPNLAVGLEFTINRTRELIAGTSDVTQVKVEDALVISPEARELLSKVEKSVEEKLSQLPEIPAELLLGRERSVSTIGEALRAKSHTESELVPVAKPKTRKANIPKEQIADFILNVARERGGFIEVGYVAEKLGVPREEVIQTLVELEKLGKISIVHQKS